MVRIRLKRMGRRNLPFYRVNAVEKTTPRDGTILENLGWYNPLEEDEAKQYSLNSERIKHWMSVGAQPTDTVKDLMVRAGLYDAQKRKAEHQARFGRKMEAMKKAAAAAPAAPAEAKAAS